MEHYGICSNGPEKELETAMVNEPSVYEPLKFYCNIHTADIRCFIVKVNSVAKTIL